MIKKAMLVVALVALRASGFAGIVVDDPESVGGTPADRMIHRETNQLLICW